MQLTFYSIYPAKPAHEKMRFFNFIATFREATIKQVTLHNEP